MAKWAKGCSNSPFNSESRSGGIRRALWSQKIPSFSGRSSVSRREPFPAQPGRSSWDRGADPEERSYREHGSRKVRTSWARRRVCFPSLGRCHEPIAFT
ncbi:Sphingosine-1-Phosphate Phosphatase 2 [Manis pentadactyla]|nr:Sphingosine-1-Phosphate Phosphatase 2 [Manis pentadactyla]